MKRRFIQLPLPKNLGVTKAQHIQQEINLFDGMNALLITDIDSEVPIFPILS